MDMAPELAIGELGSPTEATLGYFDSLSDKFSDFATDLLGSGDYGISKNQFLASSLASFLLFGKSIGEGVATHSPNMSNIGWTAFGAIAAGIGAYLVHETELENDPKHPEELFNETPEISTPLFPKRNVA